MFANLKEGWVIDVATIPARPPPPPPPLPPPLPLPRLPPLPFPLSPLRAEACSK